MQRNVIGTLPSRRRLAANILELETSLTLPGSQKAVAVTKVVTNS